MGLSMAPYLSDIFNPKNIKLTQVYETCLQNDNGNRFLSSKASDEAKEFCKMLIF